MTAIVYNCNTESLGEISESEFAKAFENAIRVKPKYRELSVRVKFSGNPSGVVSFTSDDHEADLTHEQEFQDEFYSLAELAFVACL